MLRNFIKRTKDYKLEVEKKITRQNKETKARRKEKIIELMIVIVVVVVIVVIIV